MKPRTRIILLSIISILIVVTIVLGVTYSFMKADIESSSVTEVSLKSCAKITLKDTGVSINLNNTYPMSKNKALQTTPYTFTVSSSCENYVGFNLYLATLNTNTLDAYNIHYIITNNGSKDILAEGILSNATNAESEFSNEEKAQLNSGINGTYGSIYKLYNASIPLQGEKSYDLYLYVDGDVTDASTMNKSFKAGIAVKSYDREAPETFADLCREDNSNTFACKIATTYTADGENGLYYHDGMGTYTNADQEAGDNSYRYSGEVSNNYVCFGSDVATCPDEYLYRIIGVFDEEGDGEYNVKLIKNENLTSLPWDTNDLNNWALASLNLYLNSTFINGFSDVWKNMINERTWYLGALSSQNNSPKSFYSGERNNAGYGSNPRIYEGKVGLMYASDYGYAALPENWTNTISPSSNWIYGIVKEWSWTINSTTLSSTSVLLIGYYGYPSSENTYNSYGVIPTFYLKPNIMYVSGDGSKASPYRIS